MIPWRSSTTVKLSNRQIRSDPGPSAAPSEPLLLACCCYDSPHLNALINPDVRCTGQKKKSAYASSPNQGTARQHKPSPSHFTFIVCLTGFDQPHPWLSLSSCLLSVNTKAKVPTIHREVVCNLAALSNRRTQTTTAACVDRNFEPPGALSQWGGGQIVQRRR